MNRKKSIRLIFNLLLLIMVGMILLNQNVSADDNTGGVGFSVEPILPISQIDPNLGYYYLQTKPGEEQTFEVSLSTSNKETQTIMMLVEDAYTGTNGGLTYGIDGMEEFKQDETLINATSQIVKPVSETIELKPGEKKVVSFKVQPPAESYGGVKIGRLVFKSVDPDGNEAGGVVDSYQYAISIILSETGDDYSETDLTYLKLNEVKATMKRGKRLVTANLQNPEPKRVKDIDLIASITKKGSDKVIKKTEISDFQFAPNSNVDLEVDWGLSNLEAGEYTINISAENAYDKVHLTKDFKVSGDQAREINKESAFRIQTPTWVKITAVVNAIMVLIISLIIIFRNKKWQKLARNKKRNKKKNKHH